MFLIRVLEFLKRIKEEVFSQRDVFYINGNETLPPPLTKEEEETLVSQINNREARDILIEHNLRLVAYIAKRL